MMPMFPMRMTMRHFFLEAARIGDGAGEVQRLTRQRMIAVHDDFVIRHLGHV